MSKRLLERLWAHSQKLLMNRPRSKHELRTKLVVLCDRWRKRAAERKGRGRGRQMLRDLGAEEREEREAAEAAEAEAAAVAHGAGADGGIEDATSEEMVEAVIRRLETTGFVGDERFAMWWADQRVTFRPRPRAQVAAEMRFSHGLGEELIEEALEAAGADDEAACRRVADKLGRRRDGQKLLEAVMRKGFRYNVARAVLDEREAEAEARAAAAAAECEDCGRA